MRELITGPGLWAVSLLTLAVAWTLGEKAGRAWLFGIAVQLLWVVWIVASRSWGMLPLTLGMAALYVHNHGKWTRRENDAETVEVSQGWIVGNADGTLFRAWEDGPVWTPDPNKALHFCRRMQDAEEFCADDDDAWRIIWHAYVVDGIESQHRRVTAARASAGTG